MSLDTKKAVEDAIRNAASDDKRTIDVGGTISAEAVTAEATAELGGGWSLGAIYRRLRRTNTREGGFKVTKEF
jgi:hypothetical protein